MTPLVRKLAKEHGVDLAAITGTGVGGRIRKQDVLAAAEEAKQAAEAPAPQPEPPPAPAQPRPPRPAEPSSLRGTTEKMSRLRKTIAKRMVESLQVSAQLTATVEVDLTAISRIRARAKDDFKKREGASLSYLPFITKAAVEALKVHPKVNATIDTEAGEVTYPSAEHIGIAVDTEKGLLVPVIKDAGDLSIAGLAKKIADLAARTRQNKVTPDELSGGTFTITNYGSAGTLMDTPDHQPAAGGHPRHRGPGEASGGDHRPEARRGDRGPGHDVPVDVLRPPAGRRRRRGPVPQHAEGAAGRGRLRLRVRPLTGPARPKLPQLQLFGPELHL